MRGFLRHQLVSSREAPLSVWLRGVWVVWVFVGALLTYLWQRVRAGRLSAEALERLRGQVLTNTLQTLGATYVKLGQILGSRPDLLPPGIIDALASLQDRVAPSPYTAIRGVLEAELGAEKLAQLSIDPEPVAAASVAQVHHARDKNGVEIALKVQRPQAASQIDRDLSLMRVGARWLDRVPSLHLLSLPGMVESFGESLHGQLDFRTEADNNRRFAANFANVPDVRFPSLFEELCTQRVLAMEFVHGVKASQPEKVGGDRKRLARVGAETVLKMIFEDAFVHADLHPGNVMLTDDSKTVLIDVGMVAHVPRDLLRPFIETNLALAQQNGREVARLFYVHAPSVGTTDYETYERDVVQFFEGLYGKQLSDVEVSEVIGGIMNMLRKHRVKIDPSFTVVNVSLLVAEGLGKQLDPEIDILQVAAPYLQRAIMTAPPGRAPFRKVPAAATQPAFAQPPAA